MRFLLIMFSMLALLSSPALAATGASERWTVTQRSGDARIVRAGLQPASMTVNQALAPGDTIITGANGRASLTRGGDYIVVAPRSQLRLPVKPNKTGFTSIVQDLGTLLYKVRHTGVPHFSVDTPMLAAVVKGTTFTVVVDQNRSAVQVIEGLVEVTAADGGMQSLVHGGKTVFIDRSNPKSLLTADAITLGKPGEGSAEAVRISGSEGASVLSVAAATAGQVRMEAPKADATTRVIATAVVSSTAPIGTVLTAANSITTSVLTPVSGLPDLTAPAVSIPGVALPGISTPALTTPLVTMPALATPTITLPVVTIPALPAVIAPVVTIPAVTAPLVTTPVITAPVIATPVIATPVITPPVVTMPVVTVPVVTVPVVTVPVIPVPTPPPLPLPGI